MYVQGFRWIMDLWIAISSSVHEMFKAQAHGHNIDLGVFFIMYIFLWFCNVESISFGNSFLPIYFEYFFVCNVQVNGDIKICVQLKLDMLIALAWYVGINQSNLMVKL